MLLLPPPPPTTTTTTERENGRGRWRASSQKDRQAGKQADRQTSRETDTHLWSSIPRRQEAAAVAEVHASLNIP